MLWGGLTMRIVIVEQGRKPYEAELERDLETMQRCVSGAIEVVYEPGRRDAALICNDEGKLLGLPLNRALYDSTGQIYDIIAGTFFLCGAPGDSEDFTSLTEEQLQRYRERFAEPEQFLRINGQLLVIRNGKG